MLLSVTIFMLFFSCLSGRDISEEEKNAEGNDLNFEQPHIIFIMADDLGWNDVGFHGSNEIPTPNIDALAYNGIILNNYHVLPVCTPSRSALMTGRYPIHNGMQHRVLFGLETRGLPLTEKLLPEYLQKLGYSTHIVGKWHLGFYKKEYTPTFRGFESHVGFWTGHQDYYDHTAEEWQNWGLDMRRGLEPAWDLYGEYSTWLFTKESIKIIKNHNSSKPLFLYIAHAAVHSANSYNPLPAPDSTVEKMDHIRNYKRRKFAAMVSELDTSVGKVVQALREADMLKNSLIVFTTDNGGPANGLNLNTASNWPLRGVKNTLWEGGTRGVGLLWSPSIPNPGRVSNHMMHICDWLPTMYTAAGGDHRDLSRNVDGMSLWETLINDTPSPRKEFLHNIDDIFGNAALTVDRWKIIKGSTYKGQYDGWYGPTGRDPEYRYNIGQVLGSTANRALSGFQRSLNANRVKKIRQEATLDCRTKQLESTEPWFSSCKPLQSPCLFDVENDPCEIENLANRYPRILKLLDERLNWWNTTAVPPAKVHNDPRGNPKFWGNTWTNFGDLIEDINVYNAFQPLKDIISNNFLQN